MTAPSHRYRHHCRKMIDMLWKICGPCLLLCLINSGCDLLFPDKDACGFGVSHTLAHVRGLNFDAVSVGNGPDGPLVAWSSDEGLHSRALNAIGGPRAEAVKLGERCMGGLDVAGHPGGYWLACNQPPSAERDGQALVYKLDRLGKMISQELAGTAGPNSEGVRIVATQRGYNVGWHDGEPGQFRVMLVERDKHGPRPARTLSDPGFTAEDISLVQHGGKVIAAWTETRFRADGSLRSRLRVSHGLADPVTIGDSSVDGVRPVLLSHGEQIYLGFRDREREGQRPQLYAVELDNKLKVTGKPSHIGRANSGAPSLVFCGHQRFALLPLVYGGDRYIQVHRLNDTLLRIGKGHEYYTNKREVVLADGTCQNAGMMMVAGERAAPDKPGIRLMSSALNCDSGS